MVREQLEVHYDDDGVLRCNKCLAEVWYLAGGYICSGKAQCINEDDDEQGLKTAKDKN